MSDEKKSKTDRFADLEALVKEIHSCLMGVDKLKSGEPGLVDVVREHKKEIYGDEETGREGLKPQVKMLTESNKQMKWWISGVVSVAGLTIVVVGNWSTIVSWFK